MHILSLLMGQVYPGQQVGGIEADAMAANELNTHASLQQQGTVCQNIQLLLGGFETKTGEQVCFHFYMPCPL